MLDIVGGDPQGASHGSMRRSFIVSILAATGLSCQDTEPAFAPHVSSVVAAPSERIAVVYFTSELLGQVEPCGCRSRPLGGIARIAALVDRPGAAWVDSGDYLLPRESHADEEPQHRLKARHLARIFRLAGGVGLNLGPAEVSAGSRMLRSLQEEGRLPLVSANVRPVAPGGPSVARSMVRTVGSVRVGISAFATPEDLPATGREDFVALEHGPLLLEELRVLREAGAEVSIVLASVRAADIEALLEVVPGIDMLLHGGSTDDAFERPAPPRRVGDTLVVDGGAMGRYVSRIELHLPAQKGEARSALTLVDPGRTRRLDERIRAYEAELARLSGAGVEDEVLEPRRARLDAARRARAQVTAKTTLPYAQIDVIPVDQSLPAHARSQEEVAAYHRRLERLNAERGSLGPCRLEPGQAAYTGTEACRECHPEAYTLWSQTRHAQAWRTLVERGKQADLTCVGCHAVGFRQPGGFCRLVDGKALRDVGCEDCHGPGSLHVAAGDPSHIALGQSERICSEQCHVPEHSDQFQYETYRAAIVGPGHGLPREEP